MDITIYLFFSAIAVILFIYTIIEKSWFVGLINLPFLSLIIPSSWAITSTVYDFIPIKNTSIFTNSTNETISQIIFQTGTITYPNEYHWILGVLWTIILFINIALIFVFYSTGDFSLLTSKAYDTLRKKKPQSYAKEVDKHE